MTTLTTAAHARTPAKHINIKPHTCLKTTKHTKHTSKKSTIKQTKQTQVFLAAFASGAHVSPAVSIGGALSGHAPWGRALLYVTAQVMRRLRVCVCGAALATAA